MPQPKSIPQGKGGKPYGKRSKSLVYNMVRLNRTYYSLFKLQAKFSKIVFPSQIPANYANSAQFAPTVREFCKFRTIRPHSPRILQNLHIFNLFYIMFQVPAPAENFQKFQRIMQIPCSSPTQSTNYAKFAPFANITPYVSDAWPVAENSLKFQQIKRNLLNSPNYSANHVNSAHFALKFKYM